MHNIRPHYLQSLKYLHVIAALKSSSVKVAGRDVLATWKLLVGLVLVPSLYTFYSFIVLGIVWMSQYVSSLKSLVRIYIGIWITIACISYVSLMFGEISLDIAKSLKPMVLSLLDPSGVQTLREVREKLSTDITDLINEYGPKAFSDFDSKNTNIYLFLYISLLLLFFRKLHSIIKKYH